jgi:hypothetical protein
LPVKSLSGLGIGVIVGLIIFGIVLHFVSYLYKAGQIAMMTGAVTAGTLPDNVLQAGKQAVKERFTTVSVYYVVTSAISGIFHEISRGVTSIANAAGGEAGNTIGSIITGVIDTIVGLSVRLLPRLGLLQSGGQCLSLHPAGCRSLF